jgi:hypothetical protein
MARSDVIRADLDRVRSMSDEEFAEQWGEWARQADRDPKLVQQRWIADLEHALPYAEAEEAAVEELVAAKDAYRADPSAENKARRAAAVEAVSAVRAEERSRPGRQMVAGDAFISTGA